MKEIIRHDEDVKVYIKRGNPFLIMQCFFSHTHKRTNYAYSIDSTVGPKIIDSTVAIFKITPKNKSNGTTNL